MRNGATHRKTVLKGVTVMTKIKKIFISLFALASVFILGGLSACSVDVPSNNGGSSGNSGNADIDYWGSLYYELLSDDTYGVKIGDVYRDEVVLPAAYQGKAVTQLLDGFAMEDSVIETVVVPASVTKIGASAFEKCKIESVVLQGKTATIGQKAFYQCENLTAIYYQGTQTEWQSSVSVGNQNGRVENLVYFYSETEPAQKAGLWHYNAAGQPEAWAKRVLTPPSDYTGFQANCVQEINWGKTLDITKILQFVSWDKYSDDWIPYYGNELADYSLTLSNGNMTFDLTGRTDFDVDETMQPGDWTWTYTVTEENCRFAGTYTNKLKINPYPMEVQYSTENEALTHSVGGTVSFDKIFAKMNFTVKSYYTYTVTFIEASYQGVKTDLMGKTDFYFDKEGEYEFTFFVENSGGFTYTNSIVLTAEYDVTGESSLVILEPSQELVTIPVSGTVSNVNLGGKEIAHTVVTDGIQIAKSVLYEYPGLNYVGYTLASGEVRAHKLLVVTDHIDFENGTYKGILSSYGRYATDGQDGKLTAEENVGAAGNTAINGSITGDATNIMNLNFDVDFLRAVFKVGGADYFTFDMLCDLPYLRFVREGGGYIQNGTWQFVGNTYLVSDANDVAFGEGEKIEYNGQTLYRFSILYIKEAYTKLMSPGYPNAYSTVCFDFTLSVDLTAPKDSSAQEKFAQVSKNVSLFYVDNIRVGNYNADTIDFSDGVTSGNLFYTRKGTTGGALSVMPFGDDYALKHVTSSTTVENATALAFREEYLHEVFNVKKASALTFKVYVDPNRVDEMTFTLRGINTAYEVGAGIDSEAFTLVSHDENTHCYTYSMSKEIYSKYFDKNGDYKSNSFVGYMRIYSIRLGMQLKKGGQPATFGTTIYFDDFTAVTEV